jgi:hypothetical protein
MKTNCGRVLVTILLLCVCGSAWAADPLPAVRRSPFIAPARFVRSQPLLPAALPATVLHLRATMIARGWSMADVNGTMLTPGETIDGYRLLQVRENEAVFMKDGSRVVVSIDDKH